MRFAYADPPYLGQGKRYAHLHPDALVWDDPATHIALVDRLETEYPDGWAASLLATSRSILCYLRPHIRLAVWVKPGEVTQGPALRMRWTYELVAYRTTVPNSTAHGPKVRDSLIAPGGNVRTQRSHTGTKPSAFCHWVLDLLGYDPARDELVDLFPGEGSMTAAAAQLQLPAPRFDTSWRKTRRQMIRNDRKNLASLPLGEGAHIDGDASGA